MILLIGLLGLFGDCAFDSLEQFLGPVAPNGVVSIIDLRARQDAARNKSGSAIAFVGGLFLAVWAASGAMGALIKAVNRAYDRIETRPFWKLRLIAIAARGRDRPRARRRLPADRLRRRPRRRDRPAHADLGDSFKLFWNIARWPIAFGAVLLFFALVYYVGAEPGSSAAGNG